MANVLDAAARAALTAGRLAHLVTSGGGALGPRYLPPGLGWVIHITVDRVSGIGPWATS